LSANHAIETGVYQLLIGREAFVALGCALSVGTAQGVAGVLLSRQRGHLGGIGLLLLSFVLRTSDQM
jgi:hypothetical protein